ncbi:MAG TPA: tetratricopeptide repeat protein [Tepidisphaeraceae bacterium]|jgi:predicted Zn-dependent protease|nr:tetratricopeptide repeat protein [Tepidisphaeraceae bacterium]
MNIRPKTLRRLFVLFVGLLIVVGAGVLMWVNRHRSDAADIARLRAQGMAHYQSGDYGNSLTELGDYFNKSKAQDTDTEAFFAYATSRIKVEAPRSRNLHEGLQLFQRYLEIKPNDDKARHQLLELYTTLSYNTEAVRLADELLSKNSHDTEALKFKTIALNKQHKFDEALAVSGRLNELSPQDLVSQVVTLELLSELQTPPAGLVSHAEALRQAHPDDPRFEVLMAYAHLLAKQDAEAVKWMQSAAGRNPPDAQFVSELSRLLTAEGLYAESGTLTRRAADALPDVAVQRMLAQRLLQDQKLDELIERWKALDPKSPSADGRVLGYRALALYEMGKAAEAGPLLSALSKRTDGPSVAWSAALAARYGAPSPTPTELVSKLHDALTRDAENPALRLMLAEAYEATGETEIALQQAREVAQATPSWAAPYVQMSRDLIATGRRQEAVAAAQEALKRAPGHYDAETMLAKALFAWSSDAGPAADYSKLIPILEDIQKTWQDPDTLPIYVTVLSRTGKRDDAIGLVKSALAANPPFPSQVLLRLANVSDAEKLDLGQAVRDQLQKSQGLTPEVALSQAGALLDAKRPQDGLKLLLDAQKGHETELPWRMAVAQYRELTQGAEALGDWVALGDQFPADLPVQEQILRARSRTQDRAFWLRTIDRVKGLTGEQGMLWKIERSRWLLSGDLSEKDKADAVNLLTDVTHSAPGLAEPHRLLAVALEKVNNNASAIRELTTAADLTPDDPGTTQDLVRLLLAGNKTSDAIAYLDRLARGPRLLPEARLWLARTYAEQGFNDKAITILGEDAAPGGSTPQRDATLAGLYRRTGRLDEAAALYKGLLDKSIPDAGVWGDAADFFASQKDMPAAEQFLAKLKDVPLTPGGAELIRAQFAERWTGADEALKQYDAATKAAPASENTWGSLAGFHLRRLQFSQASAAADEGLKAIAASARLKALKEDASQLAALGERRDLQPLADALSRDPLDAGAVEMLRALSAARAANLPPEETTEKLREVADKYPAFLPLQTQVVRNYILAGQYDKAADVAHRAAQSCPNDPEPQRLLTGIYADNGEWSKAAEAAHLWRQRSPDQPMAADLMLAQIYLRQPHKDGPAAVGLLEPYAKASVPPEKKELALRLYARALLLSGRQADAAELLKPLLARSATWRVAWLEMTDAGHTDAQGASAWIAQVAPLASKDSVEEQYALAKAWYTAGTQYDSPKALDAARDVVKPLIAQPDAKPQVWLLAAVTAQGQGDYVSAEEAFRHVVRANPKSPDAQNDLAYALWLRGRPEDLVEAQKLAQAAVAAQPTTASFYDTLARVQAKAGDRKSAIATFRTALEKDPNSLEAMIGMADLLTQEPGKRDEARDLVAQIKRLMEASPPLPTVLRQQYQAVRDAIAGSF